MSRIIGNRIESKIYGIPCIIGIDSINGVNAWNGSAHTCDSSDDYYGYVDIEFTVLDRKGYKADWLARKMTESDVTRIENEIVNSI